MMIEKYGTDVPLSLGTFFELALPDALALGVTLGVALGVALGVLAFEAFFDFVTLPKRGAFFDRATVSSLSTLLARGFFFAFFFTLGFFALVFPTHPDCPLLGHFTVFGYIFRCTSTFFFDFFSVGLYCFLHRGFQS